MKKTDYWAIACLFTELAIVGWYGDKIWEAALLIVIMPFYSLILWAFSLIIALIMSVITMTFKASKITLLLKFFLLGLYRFVKMVLQNLGYKHLEEKTKWFPKIIQLCLHKRDKWIKSIRLYWKLLCKRRKILYTSSFFPLIITVMILALFFSRGTRKLVYSYTKGKSVDFLIKIGLKKRKKKS